MKCDNAKLLKRIQKLENENLHLRERVDFLEGHPTMHAGIKGETIISIEINGKLTSYAAPYDVVTKNGRKIEVKFSNLSTPVKGAKTRRWTWSSTLGVTGRKVYDRLILVGVRDIDVDYGDAGKDPYIFFDVPFEKVPDVMRGRGFIQMSSNPSTARSSNCLILYENYLVTLDLLEWRYGKFY